MSSRHTKDLTASEKVAVAAFVVVIVTGAVLLGGLIFMLLWNYALVPIVAACGGSLSQIGFWVAVGGNLVLAVIQQSIRSGRSAA